MPTVRDVLAVIDSIAPPRFAFPFDRVGLQIGDPDAEVRRAVVALDRSLGAVSFARDRKAQLLLTHHPLIFEPLAEITTRTHEGRTVRALIEGEIHFVAAHTNWDCATGGVNDALASLFELADVTHFGTSAQEETLLLSIMCPSHAVDGIVDAAAAAGAGTVGCYDRCAFMVSGRGSYRPGAAARPTVGAPGRIESVEEIQVQMQLRGDQRAAVESAIVAAHPYEQPAFEFVMVTPAGGQPSGRVGRLPAPTDLQSLAAKAESVLNTSVWAWGDPTRRVERVALVGGGADGEWRLAHEAGADAMITGEVKQHVAVEAVDTDFALLAAGHFATEHPGCAALASRMRESIPEIEWTLFEPSRGFAGRPFGTNW